MRKIAIVTIITSVASLGAVLRVLAVVWLSERAVSRQTLAGQAVVTVIALLWWQMIIYGLLFRRRKRSIRGQPRAAVPGTSTTSEV